MSSSPTQDLESTGQLATRFQLPVTAIERALRRQRIRPALRLNGVAYYSAEASDAMRADLARGPRPAADEAQAR